MDILCSPWFILSWLLNLLKLDRVDFKKKLQSTKNGPMQIHYMFHFNVWLVGQTKFDIISVTYLLELNRGFRQHATTSWPQVPEDRTDSPPPHTSLPPVIQQTPKTLCHIFNIIYTFFEQNYRTQTFFFNKVLSLHNTTVYMP